MGGERASFRGSPWFHQAGYNFVLNFRTGAWVLRPDEWILRSHLLCNSRWTGFQSPEALSCNCQQTLKLHKSL